MQTNKKTPPNLLRRGKLRIAGYAPDLYDPGCNLVCYTQSGGRLVLRNHPDHRSWYASRDGRFFHCTRNGLREVKASFSPACSVRRACMHTAYPKVCGIYKLCHHLMWEVWKGVRTPGMEIDHINGNKFDWSLDNLEEVTPKENRKRAVILREMRRNGLRPESKTAFELQGIFAKFEMNDNH